MSKKLVNAISGCIIMVCAIGCVMGYVMGDSSQPWWLIMFAGVVICAMLTMFGNYSRAEKPDEKHKALIGAICASVSMLAVLIFLILMFLAKLPYSWIVVMVGGVLSGIIYKIDEAVRNDKKEKDEKKKK